jgi:hypothetical protein
MAIEYTRMSTEPSANMSNAYAKPPAASRRVQLVALVMVAICYFVARDPETSGSERKQLATKLQFSRFDLAVESFALDGLKSSRAVHPSLQRISAWISGTGAAATLGDLDADGLENDLVLIDPRVDRVVVMPVPDNSVQSVQRYEAFALDIETLPFQRSAMSPTGTLIGDFNEDGLADVLVYFWGRSPVIFLRCDGSGSSSTLASSQFSPVELVPGLVGKAEGRWYTHAATQSDFDGDGHLDLAIGNFFQDGADILNEHGTGVATVMHEGKSRAKNGGGAKLLRWTSATAGTDPTVQYADYSSVLEEHCGRGWVLALGAADLDRDGLPELYIAHDFGPDRLLHNRSQPGRLDFARCEGQRTFTTPRSFVLGRDSFKGMGVGFGDVNCDGFLDIFVSNIADEWALQESHFLWVSTGKIEDFKNNRAPYEQQSERYGLSRSGWGWDSVLVDLDNDGRVEAIQATGFAKGVITDESKLSPIDRALFAAGFLQHGIPRWPELQAVGTTNDRLIHDPRAWPKIQMPTATLSGYDNNPIYIASSSGRYVDISSDIGLGDAFNTRGIAVADTDGDGLMDFVFANQWEPSVYFRNALANNNRALSLRLLLPVDENLPFEIDPATDVAASFAVGATASLILDPAIAAKNQMVTVAEVLSGTGHSGHGSQEIHFGLAEYSKATIDVQLRWRSRMGALVSRTVTVTPGRHTILLGNTQPQDGISR